jgi:acetyl esterase
MHLHKEAQLVLDMVKAAGRPPFETLTPSEARTASAASRPMLQPDPPEVAEVRDLVAGSVPVRLYRGLGTSSGTILPCLIYLHGGGWVIGDIAQYDQVCRRLANLAGCCVISVEYRLAPEHKFPAGVDDCASATRWIIENGVSLAIDPARIAVGGDSAGGNLSAVMCLMARDGVLPPISYQVLIYPAVDLTMTPIRRTIESPILIC